MNVACAYHEPFMNSTIFLRSGIRKTSKNVSGWIATLRFGLAASALFIIYVETETGSSCPTNVSLLYFSIPDTSTAIYVITSHKKELSWRVFVAMEAADITVCTVLICLSSGTNMKLWVDRPLSGPATAKPRFKWKFHHEPTASTASR